MAISLNTLNIIVIIIRANFQLSYNYLFRKIAWNWFSAKIRCFWTPRGVKNANFEKSWKVPLDNHLNNICTNFQLSNPFLFREIALDRMTDWQTDRQTNRDEEWDREKGTDSKKDDDRREDRSASLWHCSLLWALYLLWAQSRSLTLILW